MRIKVSFLIIMLCISLLSACAQKTIIFSGESVNWHVQYEFTQAGEYIESTGYFKYKGVEPVLKEIEWSLDQASGNGPLNSDGVMFIGKSGCSRHCSLPSEESEFLAVVKWDDQTEIITLKLE